MFKIAYCSNVHAGADLAETRGNLETHAKRVKELFSPEGPMGIGLWLSAQSAGELVGDPDRGDAFRLFLAEAGLNPFTFNGFPFGNFHQEVVKREVYLPTWFQRDRLGYTQTLARLIDLLAAPGVATISTLPIGWRAAVSQDDLQEAGRLMRELVESLRRMEAETGRLVRLCIEPEPGCVIQYSRDVVDFVENYLLIGGMEDVTRRHICVCHDICHAVVMCEEQSEVLQTYRASGIGVGKVQVSSAIVVDFDEIPATDRGLAHDQLSSFAEDRYLHQTTVQKRDGEVDFYDDLPMALAALDDPKDAEGTWRIHFHVPVHLSRFGLLQSSQQAIRDCVECCRDHSDVEHFEVETYAWNVLPADLRPEDLSVGIADELAWFSRLAEGHLD